MEGFNNELLKHIQAAQEIVLRRKFEEIKHLALRQGERELYIILSRFDFFENPERFKEFLKLAGYEIEIINKPPQMLPLENPDAMTYKAQLRFDDIRIKISKIIIDH